MVAHSSLNHKGQKGQVDSGQRSRSCKESAIATPAANAGRATTPAPAASCKPSSSSRSLPPGRGTTSRTLLYHALQNLTCAPGGDASLCYVLPLQITGAKGGSGDGSREG